jgi:hypothetical protein
MQCVLRTSIEDMKNHKESNKNKRKMILNLYQIVFNHFINNCTVIFSIHKYFFLSSLVFIIFNLHHIILYYQSLFLSSLQFRLKHFYSRSPIFEEGPFENMLYKLTTFHQIPSRHKHQEKCKRHEIPQKDIKLEHLLSPLEYHLT